MEINIQCVSLYMSSVTFFDQIVNFCIPSHLVTRKPTSETTVDVNSKLGPEVLIYTAPNGPPVDLPFDSEGRYVYPAYLIRGDKIHSQEVHFRLLGSFLSQKPREWCINCWQWSPLSLWKIICRFIYRYIVIQSQKLQPFPVVSI